MRVARVVAVVAVVALAVFLTPSAHAQSVGGTVVDRSGQPVSGVVVLLVDSAARVAARALSDDHGVYRVSASHAGVYRLRTLRIGFAPTMSAAVRLGIGETATRSLTVSGIRVLLDTIRVVERGTCRISSEPATAVFAVWDQARAALTAVDAASADRAVIATTVTYDRVFDPALERLLSQNAAISTAPVSQPWRSASPEELHARGYVLDDATAGTTTYRAPGIDALLSPSFVEDHCFGIVASTDSARIGLAFGPADDRRRIAEIQGTMWLDRHSSTLLALDFEYVNIPRPQLGQAGGEMTFARMRTGAIAIGSWSIRMPVLAAGTAAPRAQGLDVQRDAPRITSIEVHGGELTLARRGADTVWTHSTIDVPGIVTAAPANRSIGEARVSVVGTTVSATSAPDGHFVLPGLTPGSYTFDVRTPALDSLGVASRVMATVIDATVALVLRVPDARDIAARGATFTGHVVVREPDGTPVVGAEVAIPEFAMSARTDPAGAFRVDHVPAGDRHVVVRHVGFAPREDDIRFAANRSTDRTLTLSRVPVLDSVVVVDETNRLPGFDDHRLLALGHFYTRADIEKFDGGHLSGFLGGMPQIRLVQAPGRRAIYVKNSANCYARIYWDGMLMYGGGSDPRFHMPLFDINGVLPEQVEAVEWYPDGMRAPIEYRNEDPRCPVLVLWTRRKHGAK